MSQNLLASMCQCIKADNLWLYTLQTVARRRAQLPGMAYWRALTKKMGLPPEELRDYATSKIEVQP